MAQLIDHTGQRFGRLTVLEISHSQEHQCAHWLCRCDCGSLKVVSGSSLRRGLTTSCGCFQVEQSTTHGMRNTPTYATWDNMHGRCYRQSNPDYEQYGGRGITVCPEWHDFSNFVQDMGERPEGMFIDRKNSNGNYEVNNCRWVTNNEQQLNKRNNHLIGYQGKMLPVTEVARQVGLKPETLLSRIKAGKIEEELFKPARFKAPSVRSK